MAKTKQFVVHVYCTNEVKNEYFDGEKEAIAFGKNAFQKSNVYKVKVWDLNKGEIERNNPNAIALIKEFV